MTEPVSIELRCYDTYLFLLPIQEKQGEVTETIGYMTCCARRFMTPKPDYVTDPIKSRAYSLPECATCCKEIMSRRDGGFREGMQVDWSKTKRTKGQVKEWIVKQVRRGCRNLMWDPLYQDKTRMAPMPGVPIFNPEAAPDYDPDAFIEGKGTDITF